MSIRDFIIRKLGGVPFPEFASVDHQRQLIEHERNRLGNNAGAFEDMADTMRVRLRYHGFHVAADGSDPLLMSDEHRRASDLLHDFNRAMTLENTPTAYIDDRYDYGTEAGNRPISEDAGSDRIYTEFLHYLRANPVLRASDEFRSYYEEVDRLPDPQLHQHTFVLTRNDEREPEWGFD